MKKRTCLHILTFAAVFALLLSACQPEAAETPEPQTPAEEITEAPEPTQEPTEEVMEPTEPAEAAVDQVVSGPIVLDPAVTQNSDALFLCEMLYDGLVSWDDSGNIVSVLALNWTLSDDELDYVVELRPNVQFHDGTLLTADVVLDNFNRWFDPNHPLHGDSEQYQAWLNYFGGFLGELDADEAPISPYDGIEKVDDLTVLIHLNRPVPDFMEFMADPAFSIINTAVLTQNMDTYGTADGPAVGTGAYQLESWKETIVVTPFQAYWGDVPAEGMTFGIE